MCTRHGRGSADAMLALFLALACLGEIVAAVPTSPSLNAPQVIGSTVALSWNVPLGVTGIRLEAGTAAGLSNVANTVIGAVSSYTATNVPPGTYYVRIRAIDATGGSAPSNEIVIVVGGGGACFSPPNAPAGLTASAIGTLAVFTWSTPVGGCAGLSYVLEAGTGPSLANLAVVNVGAITGYSAVAPTGAYYVRVRMQNQFGTGPASNEVVATIGSATTPTPGSFGSGQWLVGSQVPAGRYFSDPATGCYWERQKGLSGSLNDVIANEFVGDDAFQWIVDILPTDVAFQTDSDCGNWFTTPRQPAQATIPPGVWLVGSQIAPGTYRVNAGSGCYWARLRDFTGNLSGTIDNDFVSSGGQQFVTIASTDIGFENDADCGTWTRVSSLSTIDRGQPATVDGIRLTWMANQQQHSGREPRPLIKQ